MVKLPDMQGMTVAASTHEKLTKLKRDDETYDSIIRKLIDMDQKYNYQSKTIDYEFLTYNISKVFRVTFDKNKHTVEYYSHGNVYEKNISAWNSYPPISNEDKDLFIGFIVQEKSFRLLQDMGESIDFGEFMIRRIG